MMNMTDISYYVTKSQCVDVTYNTAIAIYHEPWAYILQKYVVHQPSWHSITKYDTDVVCLHDGPGAHFTQILFIAFRIRRQFHFDFIRFLMNRLLHFFAHAAVAWATFCSVIIGRYENMVKRNVQYMSNINNNGKRLVKWASGRPAIPRSLNNEYRQRFITVVIMVIGCKCKITMMGAGVVITESTFRFVFYRNNLLFPPNGRQRK